MTDTCALLDFFFNFSTAPIVSANVGRTGCPTETVRELPHSVVKGNDPHGRPFLRFAAVGESYARREAFGVFTVFRRYGDNSPARTSRIWVIAENTRPSFPLLPAGIVTAKGAHTIIDLLSKGHVYREIPCGPCGEVRLATESERMQRPTFIVI